MKRTTPQFYDAKRETFLNGRQVVSFSVQRAKGTSAVSDYAAGMKELKKLEQENPQVRFKEIV